MPQEPSTTNTPDSSTEGQTATNDATTSVAQTGGEGDVAPEVSASPADEQGTSSEGDSPEAQEGEDDIFVKDDEGNEFIPRKAFEARLAKLTAQKNSASQEAVGKLLESLKSDPAALEQFKESLGLTGNNQPDGAQPDSEDSGPTPFESWMEPNVPESARAHYKTMADALYQTMLPHLQKMWREDFKPAMALLGKQEVDRFSSANPDYKVYKDKIHALVQSGRAKTLEDAYRIVAFDDKIKGAGAAAIRSEKDRQSRLAGSPSKRTPGLPSASKPKFPATPEGLRQAFKYHGERLGMK